MLLNLFKTPDALTSIDELFSPTASIEIEIGAGKGRFLCEIAAARPGISFVGIDRSAKWLRRGEERLRKAKLENVRLLVVTAELLLQSAVSNERIDAYYVNFPDPWPKRRHQKRRLFQAELIRELVRTLRPAGQIFVATDDRDYYHMIEESFLLHGAPDLSWTVDSAPLPFQSNFQVKYQAEGRPIYRGHAVKK